MSNHLLDSIRAIRQHADQLESDLFGRDPKSPPMILIKMPTLDDIVAAKRVLDGLAAGTLTVVPANQDLTTLEMEREIYRSIAAQFVAERDGERDPDKTFMIVDAEMRRQLAEWKAEEPK